MALRYIRTILEDEYGHKIDEQCIDLSPHEAPRGDEPSPIPGMPLSVYIEKMRKAEEQRDAQRRIKEGEKQKS